MPRIRKFVAYRRLERPYTRVSKKRKKALIKFTHSTKIIRFEMGNPQKKFQYSLVLNTKMPLQIRDNALESARTVSNRVLESNLGTSNYLLRLRTYPHHILRENPLASGAGADRFSTGMQKSYGKAIGQASRFGRGAPIMEVQTDKNNLATARKALKKAATKLPCSTFIQVSEIKA